MAQVAGWFGVPWLSHKLIIICAVIIPLEIIDVVVGNWLALKASRKKYSGIQLTIAEQKWIRFYHGRFTKLAIVLIPFSVLLVMYLAISKVPLF